MSISTSTNHFNQPYGYADILSHLATSISKRHCELSEQCLQFKLKSEGHLEKFVFMLEEIFEMGSANAFDIQDLNNIITLIENTSSDQLPYCAHRIQYFAQKVLNSITLSQPPPIIPFIPDLWNIISNYAFASYEMPYVAKTLQGWGWNELAGSIPTATVWDVVFQYLGFERATVPLPVYESMLKFGDDKILNAYATIYHAAIDPTYYMDIAENLDRTTHFYPSDHTKAFKTLLGLNYNPQNSNNKCEQYWLQRRMQTTRMPFSLDASLLLRDFEDDFGATFFGPLLYREIVEYKGQSLNNSSITTFSPFLRSLNLTNSLHTLPVEKLLTHYRFLQSLTLGNYIFNKVQIIENKYLKEICFRFLPQQKKQKNKDAFQLYIKNASGLRTITIAHWEANFRLDVINSIFLDSLHLVGLAGANRIKLRNVPFLEKFHLTGDVESIDIENCSNLKYLSFTFKNKVQNPNAYFNINTSSITCLKLNVVASTTQFYIPDSLLNVILKQRKIQSLELSNIIDLPEIFLSKIGPQLMNVKLNKVHKKIWTNLSKNCTQITSQFKSPFKESKDNIKIWSIIHDYEIQSGSYLLQDKQPSLFNIFRKYGMFMEFLGIFPIQRDSISIFFGN